MQKVGHTAETSTHNFKFTNAHAAKTKFPAEEHSSKSAFFDTKLTYASRTNMTNT